MLTVRVSKERWHRGDRDDSGLLMANRKMCCIGFLARECGEAAAAIRGCGTLGSISHPNKLTTSFITKYDLSLEDAYGVNDDANITDTERMKKLRVIGKKMGVKFIFVP